MEFAPRIMSIHLRFSFLGTILAVAEQATLYLFSYEEFYIVDHCSIRYNRSEVRGKIMALLAITLNSKLLSHHVGITVHRL